MSARGPAGAVAFTKRELEEFVRETGNESRETWLVGDLAGRDPDVVSYGRGGSCCTS